MLHGWRSLVIQGITGREMLLVVQPYSCSRMIDLTVPSLGITFAFAFAYIGVLVSYLKTRKTMYFTHKVTFDKNSLHASVVTGWIIFRQRC